MTPAAPIGGLAPKPGRLEGLQALRGLAALSVMWCHLKYYLDLAPRQIYRHSWLVTDVGAIGVDVFFVISGFVITMTVAGVGANWRMFLARRMARVVPLYFLISALLLVLMATGWVDTGTSLGDFRQIFNTFDFLPVFDRASFTNPISVNGWTLSFEIWFYLLFALLIALAGTRAATFLPLVVLSGVVVTAAFYHGHAWFLPKFLFHPLTLEFCAGCVLFQVRNRLGKGALCLFGLLLPVLLYFAAAHNALGIHTYVVNNVWQGMVRAGVWGGFAVCLVGLVTQLDLKYSLHRFGIFLPLGDASYSIYLVAPLVMPLFRAVAPRLSQARSLPPLANGVIYVFGTVLGGLLLWKYLEVPCSNWTKKFLLRHLQPPPPHRGLSPSAAHGR